MSERSSGPTLLEELDARQNEVLRELNELNARVESLIRELAPSKHSKSDCAKRFDS